MSVGAIVHRDLDAAVRHAWVRAEVLAGVEVGIGTVEARFKNRNQPADSGCGVANDDDLAVRGLPEIAGIDGGATAGEILKVGATGQDLARDASAQVAARDRNDVAVSTLARAPG